ncbi:DUF397 domain-containing protein [Nocardia sp. NBC_01499]|uniref:DUF397 domain-containing protein n=1 Tax=Nocardia sp. NBC_01499 TaxID=2903597 RepID=UPI00386B0FEC
MSNTGTWFKSSFSKEAANCVEIRFAGDSVLMRDSKYLRNPSNDPAYQPIIAIDATGWGAFLSVANGLDAAKAQPGLPTIELDVFGVTVASKGTRLRFTLREWESFLEGTRAGEFAA